MKKQTLHRLGRAGCIALATVFALSAPNAAFASASSTQKDETVYVNLDSSGNALETVVSDWLHADGNSQRIADRSNLSNIQNVKTNEKALRQGDTLSWVLDTDNTGKNIYYQGTTDKKTPLSVSVAYTLDGKPVTAGEIAGKSGKVTISLSIRNTDAHTVGIRGKDVVMYTPMTAVAAAVLPSDTFQNVKINSGKLLTDGNNQFITFLAMPGLSESLDLKDSGFSELNGLDFPETLTIEADAEKFKLPSMTVAATPKLVDSDKLAQTDDVSKLVSNLDRLKSIQNELENADPQKNISSLLTDPDRTAAARLLVDDVFDFYGLDTRAIDILPQYVNDGNIRLCDRVTSDLNKADLKYLLDSHVLSGAASGLAGVDTQKAQALMNDYAALGSFDASKLNGITKLLGDYSKVGGSLNSVLQDTGNLLSHTDAGALATLGALGSSGVQSSLSGTLGSMNSLSNTLTSSGISSVSFDKSDIEALLTSYIGRNLSTLMKQTITNNSTGGNISVAKLSGMMTNLAADPAAQAALMGTLTQQPALMTSFVHLNPGATIPAASLSQIKADATLDSTTLKGIRNAISSQPGLIDKSGNINVAALLGMMSTMQGQGALTPAVAADLEGQMIPIVLSSNPNAVISDTAVETALGTVLSTMSDTQKSAVVSSIAGPLAQNLTPSVNGLLSNSANLQASLTNALGSGYASKLSGAMSSAGACKPYLDSLQTDLGKITWNKQDDINSCLQEAEALLADKNDLDYLASWAGKLQTMSGDLKSNSGNIAALNSLMKTGNVAKLKTLGTMLPTLQKDFNDVYSVAGSLQNNLNRPEISASMHKLPQTANTLLKMERDINGSRDLMNIFRQATEPQTITAFRDTLNSVNSLQNDGTLNLYQTKLNSAEDLLAKKDAYLKLADQSTIFSESADGASTTLKFVYKTAEIKEPQVQPAVVKTAVSQPKSSGNGFWGWLKSLFHR